MSDLPALSQKELQSLIIEHPCAFASWASNGRWKPYAWLRYLSSVITPALHTGGGRFLVEVPPQHGKSEFISHWLPTWFLHKYPARKVILACYSGDYSAKWGAKVREELTLNPRAAISMRYDTKSKKRFMTSLGGQMITAGIGGTVTGESADLLIIDDPFKNWEEAMSDRVRERNMDWYRSVARTRLQAGATALILHTRWHENDMIGELAAEGGWERIRLPAVAESGEIDPLGRQPGDALCPERYDAASLADIQKDVGGMIWEALFQQNPVAKGGNIVHGDWIQYYDELPKDMEEIAIFADLTYKEGEESDYVVVESWGRKGPNIYLISQIRGQMGFGDQIDALTRMISLYPSAFHKEIEEAANGAAVIEVLKQKVPGIFPNKPKTSKEARLHAVAPIYQARNVWYPRPEKQPWVKVNLTELTKFPRWKNDDTVDTATMAVGYFGRMASSLMRMQALSRR